MAIWISAELIFNLREGSGGVDRSGDQISSDLPEQKSGQATKIRSCPLGFT
jgi:hypothetical protein